VTSIFASHQGAVSGVEMAALEAFLAQNDPASQSIFCNGNT
jgi:hypothetical protein